MNARVEKHLMLIGIPLFMLAYFVGNQFYKVPFTATIAQEIATMLVLVLLLWMIIRHLRHYLLKKYPHYRQTLIRVVLSVFFSGLIGMILAAFLVELPKAVSIRQFFTLGAFVAHFGPMFFFSALVIGAHEVLHNFYEFHRIEKEREEMKKAHLQSQLDSLKSQINPHFLFNSLNTLLSLIPVSPQRAEHFVEELSTVYRYLLQTNEQELVSLGQELNFSRSYFHLLKTRFGEGISLCIAVEERLLTYQVPALCLQLLLENAVKHNVVAPSSPLEIRVYTCQQGEEVRLMVSNNLQRKIQAVPSSRMGLSNIMLKLRLLNHREIHILEDEKEFKVSIPLINPHIA